MVPQDHILRNAKKAARELGYRGIPSEWMKELNRGALIVPSAQGCPQGCNYSWLTPGDHQPAGCVGGHPIPDSEFDTQPAIANV